MGWIGNAGEARSVLRRLAPTCLCYTPAPPMVNRRERESTGVLSRGLLWSQND